MALVAPTNITPPLEGQQLLQHAIVGFQAILSDDQRAQLQSIKSVPDEDAVLVFTAELDRKRQRDGRLGRSIASRLSKVLQSVRSFSSIIDTYVSSHPEIAALVWGSMKLTMHIVINFVSYYEAVAEFLMKIGQTSPLYDQYQALFPGSKGPQQRLCEYHASLLMCCSHIVEVIQRSMAMRLLNAIRASFDQEFEQDAKEINSCRNRVEDEIRLATAQAIMRNQELLRLEARKSMRSYKVLSRFRRETSTKLDSVKTMQLLRDEEAARSRKQHLLEALSSHDYLEPFHRERKKRFCHTANWIFDTNEFKHWMSTTGSALLWCSGKMGSGKTILCTSMIDHIFIHKSRKTDLAAFFFAQFDRIDSLRPDTILRSIVRQLIDRDAMSEDLMSSLEELTSSPSVSADHFQQFIPKNLKPHRTLFIILDGLDACSQEDQKELHGILASLAAGHPAIKVFLTSHLAASSILKSSFSVVERISTTHLAAKMEMRDIVSEAVQTAVDEDTLLVRDGGLIRDIKDTLTTHANGMLLWVTLQLREICAQRCDEDIRAAISVKALPKDLTELLNRVLSRITAGRNGKITQQLLPWILAAKRPLSLNELEECSLIEVLQPESMSHRQVNGIHRIDSWFEGLVEVDEEQRTVHFIHCSIQRFLLDPPSKSSLFKFHFEAEEADHHLGEICTTFLNFNDLDRTIAERPKPMHSPAAPGMMLQHARRFEPHLKQLASIRHLAFTPKLKAAGVSRLSDLDDASTESAPRNSSASNMLNILEPLHPFIRYAAMHWLSHTAGFEKKRSKTWRLWKNMVLYGHHLARSPFNDGPHKRLDDDLVNWSMRAQHLGLLTVLLMAEDQQPHSPDILKWAVREQHEQMVRLFFQNNNWTAEMDRTFFGTVRDGHHRMAGLLLEYSTDLDLNGVSLEAFEVTDTSLRLQLTGLQYCAMKGDTLTMQVLIEAGAAVDAEANANPFVLETPLHFSTETGHHECMKLLVRSGANVNASRKHQTALDEAIKHSDPEAVRILLAAGIKVNGSGRDPERGSYLHSAIERTHSASVATRTAALEMVKTLLEYRADVDEISGYLTPLQRAVNYMDIELVSLLTAYGADVNRFVIDRTYVSEDAVTI